MAETATDGGQRCARREQVASVRVPQRVQTGAAEAPHPQRQSRVLALLPVRADSSSASGRYIRAIESKDGKYKVDQISKVEDTVYWRVGKVIEMMPWVNVSYVMQDQYCQSSKSSVNPKGNPQYLKPWVKGTSGNPSGQPKLPVVLRVARRENMANLIKLIHLYVAMTDEEAKERLSFKGALSSRR